jgi:hypothetical protein
MLDSRFHILFSGHCSDSQMGSHIYEYSVSENPTYDIVWFILIPGKINNKGSDFGF